MCWLFHKPSGKRVPEEYYNTAQKINKDGYGLIWFHDGVVQVLKTMDYSEFLTKLKTLDDYNVVGHLRYTSMGKTNLENSHPFDCGNGAYMAHNGTMTSMRTVACTTTCDDNSDTRNLAEVIKLCKWEQISDILPLIHQITGKTGNKLVFMEADGSVTIVNKNLGVEEDGIWYSNEYHVERKPVATYQSSYNNYYTRNYSSKSEELTKVFVYGTLKKGGYNHHYLANAKYLGKAQTMSAYSMIGKDMAFPYLLRVTPTASGGHFIQGEVYEVNNTTLASLDRLEGVPSHYKKQLVGVKVGDQYISCTTYIKTTVTEADLAKEFIAEFTPANLADFTRYTPELEYKTSDELEEMTTYQLISYLSLLEEEVYGRSYTNYKRYSEPKEDIIDEIETILDFLLDTPITNKLALGYDEYLDD